MMAAHTFEEIGRAMGVSKGTAQKLYARALAKLRRNGQAQQLAILASELDRQRSQRMEPNPP